MKPEIILGPPGTGKTTFLLKEVKQVLSAGVDPGRIAYVAFTRKAANEAIERAAEKFGLTEKRLAYFRTLHSLTFRMLGLAQRQIMSRADYRAFGSIMGVQISGTGGIAEGMPGGAKPGDRALFMISKARVRNISLEQQYRENNEDLGWYEVERLARGLDEFKKQRELIDFTDMLEQFLARGEAPELELLVVDEAQDLSHLQWEIVAKLAQRANRVIVAGDDDQAIFQWAGADVEHFINLAGDVRVLDQSYRIPVSVQEASHDVIRRVSQRRTKEWKPKTDKGAVLYESRGMNVDMSNGTWLVLARNGYMLDSMEEHCRREGWIYEKHEKKSVPEGSLKSIRAWERLRDEGEVSASEVANLLRLLKHNKKAAPREGMFTMGSLQRNWGVATSAIWHEAFENMSLIERSYLIAALRRGEKVSQTPRIKLSTIHSAKGGEADNVVLFSDVSPQSYKNMQRVPDEEARVFYVGMTRARDNLHVVLPQTRFSFAIGV